MSKGFPDKRSNRPSLTIANDPKSHKYHPKNPQKKSTLKGAFPLFLNASNDKEASIQLHFYDKARKNESIGLIGCGAYYAILFSG